MDRTMNKATYQRINSAARRHGSDRVLDGSIRIRLPAGVCFTGEEWEIAADPHRFIGGVFDFQHHHLVRELLLSHKRTVAQRKATLRQLEHLACYDYVNQFARRLR